MSALNWKIDKISILPDEGNAIYQVNFTVSKTGQSPTGEEVTAGWSTYVHFTREQQLKSVQIKYNEITEEDVIGWVQEYLGERRLGLMDEMVNNMLTQKIFSAIAVAAPLPWEKT